KTFTTVNVYDPTKGTTPIQTLSNASTVQLAITDHPLIVEMSATTSGGGSLPPPPPPPAATPVTTGSGSDTLVLTMSETAYQGDATPTPRAAPAPVTTGTGSDALVLSIAEDAYQGDAQFTVAVDGKQLAGIFTATASHAAGASQNFTFNGDWGVGTHAVAVNF